MYVWSLLGAFHDVLFEKVHTLPHAFRSANGNLNEDSSDVNTLLKKMLDNGDGFWCLVAHGSEDI